ncbi:histone deacetylase family protein [Raineya orbicola]|uniref:Deacetylase n=1 Tax=Raineya orbicola TaxID=2016530 RepID=A0A2N3I6W8_9BACT|nr:histone deacetylase [Raineya orbicola]PKQ66039.1 Deacetylase [Raineya orbicola]
MLKIAWSSIYRHPLPEGHRFPMLKYDLIPEQLLYEGSASSENFFSPSPIEEKYITNTHLASYWDKLKNLVLSPSEIRKTGFPLSKSLVEREIIIAQGTVECALYAQKYGVAMNVAGGTHHAFTDRGEGFCLLNDVAIASNYLIENNLAKRILIVDLDVHQGNGTAEIFRNTPKVFTFSMHGEKNYPLQKEQSDLDVPLPDKITDEPYLKILQNTLPQIIDKHQPEFIFYIAGVDVLHTDKLGRLGLSLEGCKTRDRLVLETCKRNQIPLAISMGGGYSERIADIVEAHCNTFRLAQEIFF